MNNFFGQSLRLTRLALIGVLFTFMSAIPLVVFLFRYRDPTNCHLWCSIACPAATRILGINYEIDLTHSLSQREPCVYIANHQASLDIITCGQLLPNRLAVLAAKWLAMIPVFGQVFFLAANITIDRRNKASRQKGLDQMRRALKERDTSIWIFPEGTRSRGRGLGKFRPGAFRTAIACGVPIQSFAISTYKDNIDFRKWKSGTIVVKALAPITTIGLAEDDWLPLMDKARATMEAAIAEIDAEMHATKRPLGCNT